MNTDLTSLKKLAVNGGKPVRDLPLPYSRQTITRNDLKSVSRKLEHNWIAGKGPSVRAFERAVANYTGYEYAIAVNSATSGLYAAYYVLLRDTGRKICIPNLTFVATVNMALACDIPVKIVDPSGYSLTYNSTYDVGVSYAGYPLEEALVADDAHSLHHRMGSRNNVLVSVISTHPVKNITTGEGGVILTNNKDLYRELYAFVDHGRGRGDNFGFGFNFRMPDINAELGLSQLQNITEWRGNKRSIANRYYHAFDNIPYLKLPPGTPDHSWHLFVLRTRSGLDRDWFKEALEAEGIHTQIHYPPLVSYRHVRENPLVNWHREFPVTEDVWQNGLSIPMFSGMTEQDTNDVINAICKITGEI